MNRKRGYLYILLAAMIYSTTEVALKGLGGVFAPMQITVERVLIGALFLLPFALRSLRRNAIRLTRSDWSYFALLGFLTVTLHMSLLQMAVLHMDASATSIIYSGNPVFALAAAHLILHEASITFLGYGLPLDTPAMGVILAESMKYLATGMWWLAFFPGLALLLATQLFDVVGEYLKTLVDPYGSRD